MINGSVADRDGRIQKGDRYFIHALFSLKLNIRFSIYFDEDDE